MSKPEWLRAGAGYEDDSGMGGCSKCGDGVLGFWFYEDTESNDEETRRFYDQIEFDRALKFGKLYRCKANGCLWFRDCHRDSISSISPLLETYVREWSARELKPTAEQLRMLLEIGPSGGDLYGNWEEHRDIPCRCIMKTGEILDYALVRFTRTLPDWGWSWPLAFISDVRSIEPSLYALSLEVRQKMLQTPEFRMNYSPTFVKASNGQRFVLDGRCYFFDYQDLKGQDIDLTDDQFDGRELEVGLNGTVSTYYGEPDDGEVASKPLPIVCVVADWNEPFSEPYPPKD